MIDGREILRCEVGSTAHGVSLPGNDDLDLMSVVIERPGQLVRVDNPPDHFLHRMAEDRDGAGARSQPGDTDLMVHSLRRLARLCADGNPSILLMLYAPILSADKWGESLRDNKEIFLSKKAGRRFLGYLTAQKQRLLGERGGMGVKRPELIAEFGFDTKYAMHAVRLGYQGYILMTEGYIPVPVDANHKAWLIGLRTGKVTFDNAVNTIKNYEHLLGTAIEETDLPDKPDIDKINDFVWETYRSAWKHDHLI